MTIVVNRLLEQQNKRNAAVYYYPKISRAVTATLPDERTYRKVHFVGFLRPRATPSFPGEADRGRWQTRAPFPARKSAADVASGGRLIGPLLKTDTWGDFVFANFSFSTKSWL